MSLQFVLGNSGSGKTEYAFGQLVREAGEHPFNNYLVIVPEQFTMQTQKKLVELAPNHAIMNVDVLSFKRLAYRVFDDLGKNDIQVLEETGKNLILRKVAKDREDQLTVLRPNMSRMGYIGEVKSLISELVQYNISPEQLEEYSRRGDISPAFAAKLSDIVTMYRGFEDYMRGSFVTAEEILNVLIALVDESELLRGSVIVFDEFTGFTPIQNRLLQKILPVAKSVRVILTIDAREDFYRCAGNHELFYLSKKTIASLSSMASKVQVKVLDPVVLGDSANRRFLHAPDLSFMEQNLFRVRAKQSAEGAEAVRIGSWKNPREELTGIVREINRLVRQENYRYRDIAVVTGAVDTYGNYVEEIFAAGGIPYFLDQTTEVLFHPFIECIRAALQILSDDFSYEPVMRFLRTGFAPLAEETIDMLDNYLLAAGIRGRGMWEKRWVRQPRRKECYDLALLNEARIALMDLLLPMADVFRKKESTLGEQVRALYAFLVAIGAEARLWEREKEYLLAGKQEQSKIDGQIYEIVIKLLEKCSQLLGDEPMDIDEFSELLDAGLSAAKVAVIPPGYDCVTIGDIERTRLNHVKVLFFAGVNDGIIPKAANAGGIISEYEREMMQEANFELAPGAREQAFTQRFYLYRNLTKPSERLYLSYARVDRDGKAQRVSYLVSTVQKLFPKLKKTDCEDIEKEADFSTKETALSYLICGEHKEDWFALARYYFSTEEAGQIERILTAPYQRYTDDAVSRAVAHAIYGRNLEASATRLERFASCAYAHFLEYGLKLKERELAGFESVDIGNLYHAALERYSSKLKEQNLDWFLIADDDRDRIALEAIDEAAESTPYLTGYATAADTHLLERMRAIFKQTVWALTKQVRAGHFVPTDFEISFSRMDAPENLKVMLDTENTIRLLGRIDRLDVCEDAPRIYVKVIDYKSGGTQFDLVRVYQGLSLQLAVYMSAGMELCRKNHPNETVLPGGILYYHIDDPVLEEPEGDALSDEKIEHAILSSLRPDGLVNREADIIRAFDEHLEKKSEVIPVELKKDGQLYESHSHVASTDEFAVMETYVKNCIRRQGQEIYDGKISVNPYRDGNECSCNYCPYASVCGLDEKIPGYGYRSLEKIPKEEVLLRMETENAKEAAHATGEEGNGSATAAGTPKNTAADTDRMGEE